jgi:hypothetical protein
VDATEQASRLYARSLRVDAVEPAGRLAGTELAGGRGGAGQPDACIMYLDARAGSLVRSCVELAGRWIAHAELAGR